VQFKNPAQFKDFITEARRSAEGYRLALAQRTAIDECYYEAVQWLTDAASRYGHLNTSTGQLYTSINPDIPKLRVTRNRVTRYISQVAVATRPERLEYSVPPSPRDAGPAGAHKAQLLEDLLTAASDACGLVEAARVANFRRCVTGTYGLGLAAKIQPRRLSIAGQDVQMRDSKVEAFAFHPLRLVLDPHNQSPDLRRHEYVAYTDVWSAAKIRRMYPGVTLDENMLKTVGSLTPHEQNAHALSAGRLFRRYADMASTKGARVYQLHCKDETGRFGLMYCAIETADGEYRVVNMEEPVSPFGGCGLPLVLLHATPRADAMWSVSDVSLIKDDQDSVNLAYSMWWRTLQRYTAPQWVVDLRFFGNPSQTEDVTHLFHNKVGAIIQGKPTMDAKPPQLVAPPPPQAAIMESADRADRDMAANTSVPDQKYGQGVKSHVPDAAYQTLLRQADHKHAARVSDDSAAYVAFAQMLLGTTLREVHAQTPSTLAMLAKAGFDGEDFSALLECDPGADYAVELSESSVRFRSAAEKREELQTAAQVQMVTPYQYRRAMADLDMALTTEDAEMTRKIQRAIVRLLQGVPWRPLDLGEFNEWCLAELRKAQFDRRAEQDESVATLVQEAIAVQTQLGVQAAMMQAQAEAPPAPQAAPGADTQQNTQQPPQLLSDVLAMLSGETSNSGGQAAQPAVA